MKKSILGVFIILSMLFVINSINNKCLAGNTPTQTISYYADYPSIPDFKSVSNVTKDECGLRGDGFCYNFDNKKFKGNILLDKYAKILENAGFRADKNKWVIYTSSWGDKVENDTQKIFFYDDKNNFIITAEVKCSSGEVIDYKNRTKTTIFGQNYIQVQIGNKAAEPYRDASGNMTCGEGYEYFYNMMGGYCKKVDKPTQTTQNINNATNNTPKTKKSVLGDIVTGVGAGAMMILMGK